jgi:hypothetical protein
MSTYRNRRITGTVFGVLLLGATAAWSGVSQSGVSAEPQHATSGIDGGVYDSAAIKMSPTKSSSKPVPRPGSHVKPASTKAMQEPKEAAAPRHRADGVAGGVAEIG